VAASPAPPVVIGHSLALAPLGRLGQLLSRVAVSRDGPLGLNLRRPAPAGRKANGIWSLARSTDLDVVGRDMGFRRGRRRVASVRAWAEPIDLFR
jgi:hypothetical protein